MTLDDLRRIMVACAGEDEHVDLAGDIIDRTFAELGYDSLAVMETAARIEGEFGVKIPDEQVPELATPRALLDCVSRATVS
ncbi:actinorhodin polyketide synthase [Spongiactinospora gelatinilytica]|uniref:Actinorhodin polyketide synthase n=1 Tax=Spongiactinospora gelatinilytica TaxID=2666298 RepID=A0A2W2H098_9ACTN|nr:acyl carrier protein [Spongiactinospora gelatinilytica]PZG53353.1 actinorhodin polyketide synthase [Spongiactinospora gelatinilytica]